jgi:hypothetical protein
MKEGDMTGRLLILAVVLNALLIIAVNIYW